MGGWVDDKDTLRVGARVEDSREVRVNVTCATALAAGVILTMIDHFNFRDSSRSYSLSLI
jgi:hypothetical protein